MIRTIVLFNALFSLCSLQGQDAPPKPAEEAVHILEEGTFILLLPSHQRKIAAIDTLLGRGHISESARRRLLKRREATLYQKAKELEAFGAEFVKGYPYHRILLAYDTAWVPLLHGVQQGLFIDERGYRMPDVCLVHPVMVARPGLSPEQSLDVYYLMDLNGNFFHRPFPQYLLRHQVWDPIAGLFRGKRAETYAAMRMLRKLQKAVKKAKTR